MKPKTVEGFAGFIGRQIGSVVADQVSSPVTDVVHSIRGLSGPILRAFIDAFLAEKIATSTWPSLAVLAAVVVIHFVSLAAFSHEQDRILVGLIVLAAYVWSAFGMVKGFNASLPHIRLWLVTRLSPTRQARLLIFQWVREKYTEVVSRKAAADFKQDVVASALMYVQQANKVGPNEIAFLLADHLAPVLVRHVIRRTLILVLPIFGALLYYRRVLYPDIIAKYTDIGPWRLALYPLAAAADGVFGTHLRDAIHHI
jgi:hypothetical protein